MSEPLYPPFAQKTMNVLSDQRNTALDQLAIAHATIETLKEEIAELRRQVTVLLRTDTSDGEVSKD